MSQNLMPFIWVAIALPVLLLLQRWIHRHLHGLALLLTGNKSWALILYAIILFPGVLLHELSHWFTATILGVRTGSFSVLPKSRADGSVQLGYVEYYKTANVGPIRESLIGSAPLLVGTSVILLIAYRVFDVSSLTVAFESGDVETLALALESLFVTGDFLVWLYLLFAVGNAMLPSPADRRAWPAFALFMLAAAVGLYLLGLTDLFINSLAGPAATVFGYLALAFSLVIGVDLLFMLIIYLFEWLMSRLKGVDVIYGNSDPPAGR